MTRLLCTVVEDLKSEFLKHKVHFSLALEFVKFSVLFDTGDVVSAVVVCAFKWTIERITLVYMFVVMIANVLRETKCWFEIICLRHKDIAVF
jgi:hypothetical protein